MGRFIKLVGIFIIFVGFTISTANAELLYPDFVAEDEIFKVDVNEPTVSMVLRLTARIYETAVYTGSAKILYPTSLNIYVITGESAKRTRDLCGCLGYTTYDTESYLLDVPQSDMFVILSHEAIHLLQLNLGAMPYLDRLAAEYQAEVISRTVMMEFYKVFEGRNFTMTEIHFNFFDKVNLFFKDFWVWAKDIVDYWKGLIQPSSADKSKSADARAIYCTS